MELHGIDSWVQTSTNHIDVMFGRFIRERCFSSFTQQNLGDLLDHETYIINQNVVSVSM
jgi:hypothetical protein